MAPDDHWGDALTTREQHAQEVQRSWGAVFRNAGGVEDADV